MGYGSPMDKHPFNGWWLRKMLINVDHHHVPNSLISMLGNSKAYRQRKVYLETVRNNPGVWIHWHHQTCWKEHDTRFKTTNWNSIDHQHPITAQCGRLNPMFRAKDWSSELSIQSIHYVTSHRSDIVPQYIDSWIYNAAIPLSFLWLGPSFQMLVVEPTNSTAYAGDIAVLAMHLRVQLGWN